MKILVTGADLAPQAITLLQDFELIYAGKTPTEESLIACAALHDPVAIIARYGKITESIMKAAPSLRVVSKHGSGTDTIDKTAASVLGIGVYAAAGANAAAVAEHAVALMLACAKSVTALNERMHAGQWDKATHKSMELAGKTVGVIGFGAIGQRLARICEAMDMTVLAHDPFLDSTEAYRKSIALPEIYAQSDVLSLHCPLVDDNRKMINASSLAACKPGVILINTARGGLIDEAALLAAVQSGHVRAAGLDTFDLEPFAAAHPFCGQPGFILSPHIGGVSADAYINMGVAAARNVLAGLELPEEQTRQD